MSEITAVIQFLIAIEVLGFIGWPLAKILFGRFPDHGWGFSKIIGLLCIAWPVWFLSSIRIFPFNRNYVVLIAVIVSLINWGVLYQLKGKYFKQFLANTKRIKRVTIFILFEELLFVTVFAGWTYLRGYQPDINGLEKFMDYGYMLSILKTEYFPPLDHFLARETINYYYFGHYLAALMTMLSRVPPQLAYNLQMSLLFALIMIEGFALGAALFFLQIKDEATRIPWRSWLSGLFSAIFIGVIGNLHTFIYYFKNPEKYWYPDATRFISYTIHEFPIYSFVVNDLHGHVSDIPIVLTIIAILLVYFLQQPHPPTQVTSNKIQDTKRLQIRNLVNYLPFTIYYSLFTLIFLSFFIGTAYATNAWDFAIYLLLAGLTIWTTNAIRFKEGDSFSKALFNPKTLILTLVYSIFLLVFAILFYLPFWRAIVPISKGIGIVPLDKRSPLWQMAILWGVQLPLTFLFIGWLFRAVYEKYSLGDLVVKLIAKILSVNVKIQSPSEEKKLIPDPAEGIRFGHVLLSPINFFLIILSVLSVVLIVLPEIIFIRDIYPTHFRANTMFKFYYAAWIMLGLVCGYSIVKLWHAFNQKKSLYGRIYKVISLILIFAGLIYPVAAIEQGFGISDRHRQTTDGTIYLSRRFPGDYDAINWLNTHLEGQPTIIEAVGDSYTEYARISANTGFPTVLGWPVHEWLWRGSYGDPFIPKSQVQKNIGQPDTVASRIQDVKTFYETNDMRTAKEIIDKYGIEYVYVGQLEREKYPSIYEEKFRTMNLSVIYDKNNTRIYTTQ